MVVVLLTLVLLSTPAVQAEVPYVRLQEYQPIYIIAGKPDTKVQFSFMTQFIQKIEFYFGYTQLMMWDLSHPSAPFRDLNYNPDLFYRIHMDQESSQWLDLGAFEHESNGKDGDDSRGWHRFYLRYHSQHRLGEEVRGLWSFKLWYPIPYDSSNKDIVHYRGVWELQISLKNFLGSFFGENNLALRIYPGGRYYSNPLAGGQELTLLTKAPLKVLTPLAVFQIFHGYGENLLDYKTERWGVRAGLGF
jgi:outer membrane phospholipase A